MKPEQPAWDDLRVLLAVHRQGSFLAAGVQLGLSTSTVARRISALEKAVGYALVHRTSQGVSIEAEALALINVALGFEQSLSACQRDDARQSPYAGVVRVSLPDGFLPAAAEAAARFRRLHPETHVELSSESRFVDLSAREADIGVRGARSASPTLIEKRLGDVITGLYASEEYLALRLPSRSLSDAAYAGQDFVVDDGVMRGQGPSQWLVQRGAAYFPIRSNSVEARIRAAESGMGLVMLGVGQTAHHPRLIRVRLDTPLPSIGFYLTMHRELRKVPRVRGLSRALEEVAAEYMQAQQDAEDAFRQEAPSKRR